MHVDSTFANGLRHLLWKIQTDPDVEQISLWERRPDSTEPFIDRVSLVSVQGLLFLGDHLPEEYRPTPPPDRPPFDEDDLREDEPGPDEHLHAVPKKVVLPALADWLTELCVMHTPRGGSATFRVRAEGPGTARQWSRQLDLTRQDTPPRPALDNTGLLAGASHVPELDIDPVDIERPDAIPMSVVLEESVGRSLAVVADAYTKLFDSTLRVHDELRTQQSLVLETALKTTAAAHAENAELRAKNGSLFEFVLNERKANIEAGEKAIEDKKAAVEEKLKDERTRQVVSEGMKMLGNLGGLFLLREHPQLMGLKPAHMDTLRRLVQNPDIDDLLQSPEMLQLVEDPAFTDAIKAMINHKRALEADTSDDGATKEST